MSDHLALALTLAIEDAGIPHDKAERVASVIGDVIHDNVATKADVHELLVRLAREGIAILMISSELPEVLHIGDRILVMREGRLTAEYSHEEASEEKIMSAATGQLEHSK